MPSSFRGMYSPLAWPTLAIDTAPATVRQAWSAYTEARDQWQNATRVQRDAETALRDCDTTDRAAAIAAVRNGKPIPAPSRPQKQAAAQEARLVTDARTQLAVEAERALLAAVRASRDQWLTDLEPAALEAVNTAATAVAAADTEVARALDHTAMYAWLQRDRPDQPPEVGDRAARSGLDQVAARLHDATPARLREQQQARHEQKQRQEAEQAASIGGILPDRPGRKALAR